MLQKFSQVNARCRKIMYKFGSVYPIRDIKNSHLLLVQDQQGTLPFMNEITTDSGEKGVVIKVSDQKTSVIGMYHRVDSPTQITFAKHDKMKNLVSNFNHSFNHVYDCNFSSIAKVDHVSPNQALASQIRTEGKRKRLNSPSPILSICEDIFMGDFVSLAGALGSGRTSHAFSLLEHFVNSKNLDSTVGLYLNTNLKDSKSTCLKAAELPNTFSFGRGLQSKALSSVGIYMMAVKCIQLAKKLKQEGNNVMLVIDNLHEILANEWTVLQNLKLPISPISTLNQLYSQSCDNSLKGKQGGSLTSIITNNPQQQDVLQQYTTFGNNSKYLRTLCKQIDHPVPLRINNNSVSSNQDLNQMRQKVNRLLKEKQQNQLLTKLKLNKDQPWERYYMLDAEWWEIALKKYKPKTVDERDLLLWFINTNIEEDCCPHWNIPCLDAFAKYLDYLAHPADLAQGKEMHQFQNFVELAKAEGFYDIFKKDYLP